MEYLVSAKEMKNYDSNTIHKMGVPAMVLMERAALSVVQTMEEQSFSLEQVLIVCGMGNNGGDGFAIGRILAERGCTVTLVLLGDEEGCSEQTKQQIAIVKNCGMKIYDTIPVFAYTTIVDAIFGISLSRTVEGIFADSIKQMNEMGAPIVSVDIPSGIDADSGEIRGTAIKAVCTVTFAYKKLGLILYPGADYAGAVVCKAIGISHSIQGALEPEIISYNQPYDLQLPKRRNYGNKGTFGKVLLAAGSVNMSGAAQLCGLSAFRTGAGMVKLYTVSENRDILQRGIPESMLTVYKSENIDFEALHADMKWADVIGIGPGLGQSSDAERIVSYVLKTAKCPLIIDADALNIIAKNMTLLSERKNFSEFGTIVTPHLGEMARLTNQTIEEIQRDIIGSCREFSKQYRVTCVLKDARTVVCDETGLTYVNQSGNNGMATAGSGDVLLGIISGLLAQRAKLYESAVTGVYMHGMAGDIAKKAKGQYSMMALDIISGIEELLHMK